MAIRGVADWAVVPLVPEGPAPDVRMLPEVVHMERFPHNPHLAVAILEACNRCASSMRERQSASQWWYISPTR